MRSTDASSGNGPSTRPNVGGGAELLLALTKHHLVDQVQHEPRPSSLNGGGAGRVSNESCQRRCLGTLAADVADDDRPVIARAFEHVVEVAADVAPLSRRLVVRGDLDAGDFWKMGREQALLQRLGQLREAGAARAQLTLRLRAFDELTDLRSGGVHHLEDFVVGLATLGGEELDHAEHVAPAPDGDREPAVQAVRGGNL
jgi:hypothetical protein